MHVVATGNKGLAGVAEAGDLAARLRGRDALIVCGPDTVSVDETLPDDTEADVASADDVQATGQPALPMPTSVVPAVSREKSKDQISGYRGRDGKPGPAGMPTRVAIGAPNAGHVWIRSRVRRGASSRDYRRAATRG
jgi:hypothetical protein